MDGCEERIRQCAFNIWMEEGCPDGRSDVHWEKARELIAIEDNYSTTLKPAPSEGAEARGGEPIEESRIAENAGEIPTMVDQGEQSYPPSRDDAQRAVPKSAKQQESTKQRAAASTVRPKRKSGVAKGSNKASNQGSGEGSGRGSR